jgi:hypothetical protein
MEFNVGSNVSFRYLLGWKGMQEEIEEGNNTKTCIINGTTANGFSTGVTAVTNH